MLQWLKQKWYWIASIAGGIVILVLGIFAGGKWYTAQKLKHVAKTVARKRALDLHQETIDDTETRNMEAQQRVLQAALLNQERARRGAARRDPLRKLLTKYNNEADSRKTEPNND